MLFPWKQLGFGSDHLSYHIQLEKSNSWLWQVLYNKLWPLKKRGISPIHTPTNYECDPFWKQGLCRCIRDVRLYRINIGPNPMMFFIRNTDTHTGNTIMTKEAGTGVMCLQPWKTKDGWEQPEARRRQRGKEGSSPTTGVRSWE